MGKLKTPSKKHSLEALHELGDEFGKSVKEQGSGFGKDFFNQLLNINFGDKAHNTIESIPSPRVDGPIPLFDATHINKQDKKGNAAAEKYLRPQSKEERRAAIDYAGEILKVGERAEQRNEQKTVQTIQELLVELRRLADSSKVLQMEFASISVEQNPTKVGEYHVNFFEWMLIVIRAARHKVEDSGAWLSAVKGKNGKKNGYWGMFKKHGTTFGLSNERVVATQTG